MLQIGKRLVIMQRSIAVDHKINIDLDWELLDLEYDEFNEKSLDLRPGLDDEEIEST